MPLVRLLELIAADCTLMKPGERPRQFEARCGIRYVVPAPEPMPLGAPARAGEPKLDPPKQSGKKRLGYDGPAPTIAMMRHRGISAVSVTCHGLWQGHTCHHTTSLPLDRLGAQDDAARLQPMWRPQNAYRAAVARRAADARGEHGHRHAAEDAGDRGRVPDAVNGNSPIALAARGEPEMPKFQVTVADDAGHKLYDESIEAPGPMEACAKAVADAKTAEVAESEEPLESGLVPPFTMDT